MRTVLLVLSLLGTTPAAWSAGPADSVVKVTAMLRAPNPIRPWTPTKAIEVSGSGVVVAGNEVLTNAHVVQYATEVQVQSWPGGDKFDARVESIGPDVDLAVLTVADKKFFAGHPALPRAVKLPNARDTVEVDGFPVGGAESSVTKGVVSRVGYSPYSTEEILEDAGIPPSRRGSRDAVAVWKGTAKKDSKPAEKGK